MKINNINKETYVIIEVEGSLSVDNMNNFEKTLKKYEEENIHIIVDMTEVTYIDSSSLGIILLIYTKLLEKKKKIILANVKRDIYQMFKITGLSNRMTITSTLEEAEKLITV